MLLLRSPKGDQFSTRVDIVFVNVQATCMRTDFPDLEIKRCTGAKEAEVLNNFGLQAEQDVSVFVLKATGMPDGYIVAADVGWHEDTKEFSDKSHFDLPIMIYS